MIRFLGSLLVFFAFGATKGLAASSSHASELHHFHVEEVVGGLSHPWSIVFLPDGEVLVSERPGRLRLIRDGRLESIPVRGLPRIDPNGQGGLLDLALHPDFAENRWLYFSYVDRTSAGFTTNMARGRYLDGRLTEVQVLFTAFPRSSGGRHFGGRIVFDAAGYVYLSIGDRGQMERAQDFSDHAGSIIRLHDDGRIPADNPFADEADMKPEIYATGTRNAQGMAMHPLSGEIWMQEHGPRGGDEVNRLIAGANYGWPKATHGIDYDGSTITPHTELPGMESPLWHWTPSIAPSGMLFYAGDMFPHWQNQLFIGALRGQLISRLETSQDETGQWQVQEVEQFFEGQSRIRDIRQAPDGSIWVLTDHNPGQVLRLIPVLP
ncbi:PQQ-dependent sugar dehydrogenase [Desulfurispirillum indicum]|uniref:PQQ-dependent sugar dehydrogenase n=1 Tax=Desulfurispirillum indicum TaxID=936456 RepID=UPI001CFAB71C|nr:PQQ-dependent sugar dehydrogenase [Desulfurispirillum indicum]UCZ56100.1 PQQ-dependent sugar dehydrogenase [Desulfurispirillum indicum]